MPDNAKESVEAKPSSPGAPDRHSGSLVKGIAISGLSVLLLGVINYFTRRTLAVNISPQSYGFFYSALSVVTVAILLTSSGFSASLAVFAAKHLSLGENENAHEVFQAILWIKLLIASGTVAVLVLAWPVLRQSFFGYPAGAVIFMLLCLYIVPASTLSTLESFFRGARAFGAANLVLLIQGALLLAVVLLLHSRLGAGAGSLGYVCGAGIATVAGFGILRGRFPYILRPLKPHPKVLSAIWRFSRWTTLTNAAGSLLNQCDTLMLTGMRDLQHVAYYNIALPILQIMMVLYVVPTVFPTIAVDLWHRRKNAEINADFHLVVKGLTFICGFFFLILWFWNREVVSLLFSSAYASAGAVVVIFAGGLIFILMSGLTLNLLNAFERPHAAAWIVASGLVLNIVLNAILIAFWSERGAAAATVITNAFMFLAAYIQVRHILPMSLPLLQLGTIVATVFLLASCGNLLMPTEQPSFLPKLVVTAVLLGGYSCFSGILLWKDILNMTRRVRHQERQDENHIQKRGETAL